MSYPRYELPSQAEAYYVSLSHLTRRPTCQLNRNKIIGLCLGLGLEMKAGGRSFVIPSTYAIHMIVFTDDAR